MDLLTLFFIALVVLALVWFTYGKKEEAATKPTLAIANSVNGEGEFSELEEVGGDISEAF